MTMRGKFSSHALPISGHSTYRDTGCLLALAGWYKPPSKASLFGPAFSHYEAP